MIEAHLEIKEELKKGSLILVNEEKDDKIRCNVVNVGYVDSKEKGADLMDKICVGDEVYVRRNSYLEINDGEGKKLLICNVNDVLAKV